MPGAVVLIKKSGKIIYEKAFGSYTYENTTSVTNSTVYDLASITKICATTIALMKLYDEKKIALDQPVSEYLIELKGTNKENFIIRDLLLHQAGMEAYIPFFKNTVDEKGRPLPALYQHSKDAIFSIPVAENLYLRCDWPYCMMEAIAASPAGAKKYIYSDNDFILLGKLVERISGMPLNEYVSKYFYGPMQLSSIGFLPIQKMDKLSIAPTENEKMFRAQLLQGSVHDANAAMFGGVSGHAGVFSNAADLAEIMQMLTNGGFYKGKQYLLKSTIDLFTAYGSYINRRGLGFDKPEKDNDIRKEPYPCLSASPATFGHTGYTGTAAWADPEKDLIFIFLSNRVYPNGNDLLNKLNIRSKIMEEIYRELN